MSRLPQVGGDDGNWGEILNDYLSQVHMHDGSLKPGIVKTAQLEDSTVTDAKLASTVRDTIASKADASHVHAIADITGLQGALSGKQTSGDYATKDYVDTTAAAVPRFVIVSTGAEGRPGAAGGLVIWADTRADTSVRPPAMETQDLRFVPESLVTMPTISTANLSFMTQGSSFSQILLASGNPTPRWTLTGGELPDGLLLSSSGTLSGTPSTAGTYDFTVSATNTEGSDTQRYTGLIGAIGVVEHTVFGSGVLSGSNLNTYADGGPQSWMAQQFYLTASPVRDWKVVGMRIYVPTGSSLIGQTGSIGFQRRASEHGGTITYNENGMSMDMISNGSQTPFSAPLTAGWNSYYFNSEYTARSLDSLVVGYTLQGGYLHSSTGPTTAVQASDGTNLFFAENSGGSDASRSFYCADATAVNAGYHDSSGARWYGIDIIVRE